MKILLCSEKTKFFKDFGVWTRNENEALAFRNTKEALKFCLKHNLMGTRIVMVFNDGTKFTRLEVPDNLDGKVVDKTGRFFNAEKGAFAA
jgi:hypothetical protein